MARQNVPFFAFNRGLISPKSLARTDVERTRLSAEVMRNFLAKTQGALTIRPGTKFFGSSLHDTGAEWIEFIAATDDVALLELTNDTGTGAGAMRVWLGDDPHAIALLERPPVDTTLAITDTGWANTSSGGVVASVSSDLIPSMTGPTTAGVTITASSQNTSTSDGGSAFNVGDNSITSRWMDTGIGNNTLPSWLNVDFGASSAQSVTSYTIRNDNSASQLDNSPRSWRLIAANHDTGTFATDTGKWVLEDQRLSETGWSVSQKRSYKLPSADTGTIPARRHWRLFFTAIDGGTDFLMINEVEMFTSSSASQVKKQGGRLVFNATSVGGLAREEKRVIVSDTGTEHSLDIEVERGPITLRVGSTQRDDDYIGETVLGTGYHNLAFTPSGNFWITLQSNALIDRIVRSVTIGDSGTVEIQTPWVAGNLDSIRYDQSADVVYVDCEGVRPQKIERRGTGRSWSVVDYAPVNGPFLSTASSSAKLSSANYFGNTTMASDRPFFRPGHVGGLIRIFHEGQKGVWRLGALNAKTDPITVTGISDTGTTSGTSDRAVTVGVAGTGVYQTTIERSFDGEDRGFKPLPIDFGTAADTGSRSLSFTDNDDNVKVWYRVRLSAYTSGAPVVAIGYPGGGVTGIARVTDYNSNTSVGVEILSRFSDTAGSDNWQEGYWSGARNFPTSVALHGGRLAHAEGGTMFLTVSDDFENYDDAVEGDAGPIVRTLGSGPVDNIYWLVSLARLIMGTTGAEIQLKSSSLDEPVTPTNSAATTISTRGSANLRAVKLDNKAIHVQRSGSRLFMIGLGASAQSFGDFEGVELTLLAPDLLDAGVVSIAVQRMPDTRLHCVLADGTVGILTYEPNEEVICWQEWQTSGFVERAMVLPGLAEDAVYYHIRRLFGSGNDEYTKVLLSFDGPDASTSFADHNEGGSDHVWTAFGNTQTDTDLSRFGGASGLFDGTGGISTPDHDDFALGSGDFTIDCWFQVGNTASTNKRLCGQSDAFTTASLSSFFIQRTSANVMSAEVSDGSTFITVTGTTQFTDALNVGWHHLALVRSGNVLRLFIDGAQEGGDVSFSGALPDSAELFCIGTRSVGAINPWIGWIDEFRLSVGIARWTEDFTPPTQAYGRAHRFLEKWAKESECNGDTGLNWLADCAVSFTDTGRTNTLADIAPHLAGENVVLWGDLDTGSTPFVDLSADTGSDGSQRLYAVDTGGDITLSLTEGVHHAVAGLPYSAAWKSTKLAYGAQFGTALTHKKRVPQMGLVLYRTHNRGLYMGSDTGTGKVQPLPRTLDDDGVVDPDKIYPSLDEVPFAVPGGWKSDSRIALRAKAPRPCTVLALVPQVDTNEK